MVDWKQALITVITTGAFTEMTLGFAGTFARLFAVDGVVDIMVRVTLKPGEGLLNFQRGTDLCATSVTAREKHITGQCATT